MKTNGVVKGNKRAGWERMVVSDRASLRDALMAQAGHGAGPGWLRSYLEVHPLPAAVVAVRMPPRGSPERPDETLYLTLFWGLVIALSIGFWMVLFHLLRRYFGG